MAQVGWRDTARSAVPRRRSEAPPGLRSGVKAPEVELGTQRTTGLYYGWVMAGVCMVAMIATGPGQTVIVSQFNTALRESLGLSAAGLSTAYMIGTVCAALPLVLVGAASDRFGPRRVMGAVALLFGLACASMALVQNVVMLTAGFFLLRALGQGALGLVSGHALAMWFERRLGTVNGVKIVGTQLAFAFMPAFALWLIESAGWREAYVILGACVWACVLPLVVFVSRDRPEDVGQLMDGDRRPAGEPQFETTREPDPAFRLGEALRAWAFWVVTSTVVLNGMIGTALLFHMQPLLEWRGLDLEASAAVVRSWSLAMMVCVLPSGWLADRLPARVLLPASLVMLGGASAVPAFATSVWHMHVCMIMFGVSQALAVGVGTPTIARYFGRKHHGAIRGTVMKLAVAGTGLGPVVLGVSLDWTGSFDAGLGVFVAMCAVPGIAGSWLRRPVRRSAVGRPGV